VYKVIKTLPVNENPTYLDAQDQINIMNSVFQVLHEKVVQELGDLGRPRNYIVHRSASRKKPYERFFWLTYEFRTPETTYEALRIQTVLMDIFGAPKPPKIDPKKKYSRLGFHAPITTKEGRKQLEEYKWQLVTQFEEVGLKV
jgi:hypothetical protein